MRFPYNPDLFYERILEVLENYETQYTVCVEKGY